MRRALIIGINDYKWAPLRGCINDANEIYRYLDRNEDDNRSSNFDCQVVTSDKYEITRNFAKRKIHQLFANAADIALLYFSGHGAETGFGSYLVTPDAVKFDEGVSMTDVLIMANQSKTNEVIIMLDCCHSGYIGNQPFTGENISMLREGVSIITSSTDYQVSKERKDMGVFTKMICEALSGEAADLLGNVNLAGIYQYSDKSLSSWEQRPVFKSHVTAMTTIRKCRSKIGLKVIQQLPVYFKNEEDEFPLSPAFEYTSEEKEDEKVAVFQNLQKCVSAGLVTPVGTDFMYFAAMESKTCKLTNLGQYYWKLALNNRI